MKRHKTVKAITERMLRKVKAKILAEPRQLIMDEFFTSNRSGIPNCGTAACIAGWAISCDVGKNPRDAFKLAINVNSSFYHQGMHALGISDEQATNLFYADNWPDEFWERWWILKHNQYKRRAQVAADRIDHFIKTGE